MMGEVRNTSDVGSGVGERSVGRVLSIETPEAVVVAFRVAGYGSRGLAAVIDIVTLGAVMLAEALVIGLAMYLLSRFGGIALDVFSPWVIAALIAVLFVTYWGYYIYGEVVRNGRTPGKRVMRIRVVREDGSRVGVLDSAIRNIVRIVDLLPGTYAVGVIAMVLSGTSQRLGDMAAGTVVIADEPPARLPVAGGTAEELADLVREYLERRPDLSPEGRWQVATQVLAAYGESPQPGWDEPLVAGRLVQLAGIDAPAA